MNIKNRNIGLFFIIIGLFLCILRRVLFVFLFLRSPYLALGLLGNILLIIGFSYYAKSKGRSIFWSIFALLSYIGPIIFFCLRDNTLAPQETKKTKLKDIFLVILFLLYLVFGVIYYFSLVNCYPASEVLISHFKRNKADFEKLRQIIIKDSETPHHQKEKYFEKLGIELIKSVDKKEYNQIITFDIYLSAQGETVFSRTSKSYIWSDKKLTQSDIEDDCNKGHDLIPIIDQWYLLEEFPTGAD